MSLTAVSMSKAREIIDSAAFEFQNIDSFFNKLFLI